jgi:hypothetical protein
MAFPSPYMGYNSSFRVGTVTGCLKNSVRSLIREIAYIVLTTCRNTVVETYMAGISARHEHAHTSGPGWPHVVYLAQRLDLCARNHSGMRDRRPWYRKILDPTRQFHLRRLSKDRRSINQQQNAVEGGSIELVKTLAESRSG